MARKTGGRNGSGGGGRQGVNGGISKKGQQSGKKKSTALTGAAAIVAAASGKKVNKGKMKAQQAGKGNQKVPWPPSVQKDLIEVCTILKVKEIAFTPSQLDDGRWRASVTIKSNQGASAVFKGQTQPLGKGGKKNAEASAAWKAYNGLSSAMPKNLRPKAKGAAKKDGAKKGAKKKGAPKEKQPEATQEGLDGDLDAYFASAAAAEGAEAPAEEMAPEAAAEPEPEPEAAA